MAYLVTNPRRMKKRHNGAVNHGLAAHLGLKGKLNSPENKAKMKAFKKTEAYAQWLAKFLGGDAKTARQSSSKAVKKILAGMAKVRGEVIVARKSASAAKKSKKASPKKASSKKAAAPVSAAKVVVKTDKRGRKMYYIDGRLVSKEKAMAAGAKENGRRRRKNSIARRKNSIARRKNAGLMGLASDLRSQFSSEYTLRNVGFLAAAGVAHAALSPYVAQGLDFAASKVGGAKVADFINDRIPYTFTGMAALAGLSALGYLAKQPALYALGAAAAGVGIAFDAANATQGYMEGRAASSEQPSLGSLHYGGVAAVSLQQPGKSGYAGLVEYPHDGGASAVEQSYADAKQADAAVCGADFSAQEGQALMEGPAAMASIAPAPSIAQGHRRQDGAYSRFAGQPMHRWGWLIKAVGLARAQQIASLRPADRLKVIAALRKQAMAAVDAAQAALPDYSGVVAQEYGSLVYAGAAF
jgi:hypothetical protein